MKKLKMLFLLHIMLMIYSTSGILSKMAAQQNSLNLKFCLYYAGIIGLLGLYAIGWQQIIKRLPLTTAYANKAITVVWGLVWGILFFDEKITLKKILAIAFVVCGVAIYAKADQEEQNE